MNDSAEVKPVALAVTKPTSRALRPNRAYRQDLIRQWILLIPLATAAAGAAATSVGETYIEYLRPLFFIGALVITVAMIHQRQIYNKNQLLSESLQAANEKLDTLHRLQFDLNQSLEISQVACSVLRHVSSALNATSGALWMRAGFDFGLPFRGAQNGENEALSALPPGVNWRVVAATGWVGPDQAELLQQWNSAIDELPNCPEAHFRVGGGLRDSEWLIDAATRMRSMPSAIAVPVRWKDETIGILLMARWQTQFANEDAHFIRDVALVAGPALENALLYQRTVTRADFDGLTGLLNHRAIQERLAQELARTQRVRLHNSQSRFSIAIFDLTDFKLFNDTYGHAMGDEVLRIVSRTLTQTFRISDIVSRYGGDEFLAILPEADSKGAMTIASRVIEAIKSQVFAAEDGSTIVIRATCGIAVYPEDGESGADLFQAADERLYEAKQVGQQLIPYVRLEPDKTPKLGASALWGSFGVLDALITAIDNRDHYTRAHSEQTMCYALLLANELGEPDEILDAVRISGLLYDVGKIAVPDAILRKPGFLSEDEKYIMQQHCRFGVMIMQDVAHREHVLEGVQSHHEAYDGSGYPDKLVGDAIPWMARLLAAADCFAAMTTDRPYRKSLSPAQALEELKKMRGKQFDPAMVDAFERVMAPVTSDETELKDRLHDALVLCERLTAGERSAPRSADGENAHPARPHPQLIPGSAAVGSAG